VSLDNFNLYDHEFQLLQAILAKMQKELRADLILLISRSGQPIIVTGSEKDIDFTALASLSAANLAATDGLANLVGEKEFSVLVHQGARRNLYISDLLKQFSLIVVFDASAPLGLVRWKAKRTSALLEDVIHDFQRKRKRDNSASKYPQFSDKEIESLLGQ
jgi:predicted regulator of Ras-like GTPase activity (Roadblock/LC7/MglB family)